MAVSSAAFPAGSLDPGALYPERRIEAPGAIDQFALRLLGRARHALPRALWARPRAVALALNLAEECVALSQASLRTQLRDAARRLDDAGQLARALALVREAARRSLHMTAFDTQLLGASLLLSGKLAEMHTGEGKTLTAGLAAAIAACGGLPVHVVTVNDYLAERDRDKLAPLADYLGLRVGAVLTGMAVAERRAAYRCDITYCTGKELVFDYLKDKVALGAGRTQAHVAFGQWLDGQQDDETLLRGLHFAIVDEADSIFIDEARTPLILSLNAGASDDVAMYRAAIGVARRLVLNRDFRIRAATRELELTDAGRSTAAELCLGLGPDWGVKISREHRVAQALRALHLFQRDHHYVIKDDKVLIVDEQTGRVLPGRTWEEGLHQMIEVKEGQALSDQARTVARITYQRFFKRYLTLSGMTGTAWEVRAELWRVYGLHTVRVPTHRPCIRRVAPSSCLADESGKWQAVCAAVQEQRRAGRPVLVGTRSVAASMQVSAQMSAQGIAHRVLNALQDAEEAQLIEAAGQPGAVTVATNMAGRGTDILLGEGVAAAGGLHVILTEFHDSRRVDRQLFGRAARQGDPGSAQALVCLDDKLLTDHAPVLRRLARVLPGPRSRRAFTAWLRRFCQRRCEAQNARQRGAALRNDQDIENMLSFSGRN